MIPDQLPGESLAVSNARRLRRILETGYGTSGFAEGNFTFEAAMRLVANEVPLDDIEAVLAAWNAGARVSGVPKLNIFQTRHWPTVRSACLGETATDTRSVAERILDGDFQPSDTA